MLYVMISTTQLLFGGICVTFIRKWQDLPSLESLSLASHVSAEHCFPVQPGVFSEPEGTPKSPQVIKFSWTFWAFSEMCTDLSPHAVISTVLPHHRRCHRRCELKPWTTQLNSQQLAVWSKPYGQKSRFITQTF